MIVIRKCKEMKRQTATTHIIRAIELALRSQALYLDERTYQLDDSVLFVIHPCSLIVMYFTLFTAALSEKILVFSCFVPSLFPLFFGAHHQANLLCCYI